MFSVRKVYDRNVDNMSRKNKKTLFWASYADLMTSLFFVMLVLFSGSIITLNKERNDFRGK